MTRPLLLALSLVSACLLPLACGSDDDGGGGEGGDPTTTTTTTTATTTTTTTTGEGGSGGGTPVDCTTVPTTGDLPCDVYAVLKAKCFTCHTDPPQNYAPFPLLNFADTREPYVNGSIVWERIGPAITNGFMPQNDDLTTAEEQILLDWVAACAPPEPIGQGCDCDDPAACP